MSTQRWSHIIFQFFEEYSEKWSKFPADTVISFMNRWLCVFACVFVNINFIRVVKWPKGWKHLQSLKIIENHSIVSHWTSTLIDNFQLFLVILNKFRMVVKCLSVNDKYFITFMFFDLKQVELSRVWSMILFHRSAISVAKELMLVSESMIGFVAVIVSALTHYSRHWIQLMAKLLAQVNISLLFANDFASRLQTMCNWM